MRQFLATVLTLLGFYCTAQSITSAEYFFNTDPGVGSGTVLTVNSNSGQLTQTFSISTTSLTDGFNSLYIRTLNDDGNWGLYDRQNFYVKSFATTDILDAEYFFDTDPGIGSAVDLIVDANSGELTQTFAISTGGLSPGFHSIYVRTQNADGNWSLYDRQSIYLQSFDSFNIISAEYFFNTDPGVGSGTMLPVDANSGQLSQTYAIATESLTDGFNSFYLRTQNSNGEWSLYDRQIIYVQDFAFPPELVSAAEYFVDSDPGIGNGTFIAFGDPSQTSQVLNFDSTGLSLGEHLFYVRVQNTNGDWSIYDTDTFIVANPLKLSPVVLLQGPILNPAIPGLMNDILREDGYLPTTSPYADLLTVDPNVFNLGGLSGTGLAADDIVDWIWVELRDSGDNTSILTGKSALLQRDGDVVDLDGVSELLLDEAPADYYIAFKHRNHIGTMSLGTFGLTDVTTTMVDFTDSGFSTFGTDAQVILGSGDTALWAGNVNGDTTIQYAGAGVLDTSSLLAFILNDGSNFLNLPTWSVTGYTNNDVDMNGTTQYAGAGVLDTPYILQNILSYPGNFLNLSTWQIVEQLPEN